MPPTILAEQSATLVACTPGAAGFAAVQLLVPRFVTGVANGRQRCGRLTGTASTKVKIGGDVVY
jgi:hypothetical protein